MVPSLLSAGRPAAWGSRIHEADDLETASRAALVAAVHLDASAAASSTTGSCVRGAALLSAAAAAARRPDGREARASLQAAARCGEQLGEDRADLATVFGPTNVAIHRTVVAIELGDAKAAVAHAEAVDLAAMSGALKERRARFLIDVARAYTQLGESAAAIDALLDAERESPDETRTHRHTGAVLSRVLTRPRVSPQARAFADRCTLVA